MLRSSAARSAHGSASPYSATVLSSRTTKPYQPDPSTATDQPTRDGAACRRGREQHQDREQTVARHGIFVQLILSDVRTSQDHADDQT